MEDNDVLMSECPECKFRQEFDFAEYNRNGECLICEKCHKPYKITKGLIYGTVMTADEYKEWQFMQKLKPKKNIEEE